MSTAGARFLSVLYAHRRTVTLLLYGGFALVAYWLAFLIRFDLSWPRHYTGVFALSLPPLILLRLACARVFKLSTGRWRFIGVQDVVALVVASAVGSLAFVALVAFLPLSPRVPRTVILLDWFLNICVTGGTWISYRIAFERIRHRRIRRSDAKRVLIVGAGEAGNLLAREMCRFPTGYTPVAFVDDDPAKWGMRLSGREVMGSISDVALVAEARKADEIIIAVPSGEPAKMRNIVERCEATGLPFRVLPGIADVLSGDVSLKHLREVEIGDLLGRAPVRLDLPEIAQDLRDRSVLITGAAGSIGSELARQIAHHNPGTLVLFDQAESDLYYLDLDLRNHFPDLHIVPVVGDIVDAAAVERVFDEYGPERVFHAAAYKHVPLMEGNPREALRNNVIGTWRVAEAAGRHGTEKFVLVSTDKAARPVSVMGATKRLAELIVLELQERFVDTLYTAVRFGNVLGSSGSVIPVFRRQIDKGEPLTVTHPDATRYFMTIAEAVQLVLQASLLHDLRGHVAMLEMGEPVRIVDLAKNLLRMSGWSKGGGNGVVFTGLRPGEKLHEELVGPDEQTAATSIHKVRRLVRHGSTPLRFCRQVAQWECAFAEGGEAVAIAELYGMFPAVGRIGADQTEVPVALEAEDHLAPTSGSRV